MELINYRKDGSEFWVEFSLVPIKRGNKVAHFVSIQRETTHKKQESQLLSSILNAIPAEIAMVDLKGNIIAVNKEWKRFADENNLNDQHYGIDSNYIDICNNSKGQDSEGALSVSQGLQEVIAGTVPFFKMQYPVILSCNNGGLKY